MIIADLRNFIISTEEKLLLNDLSTLDSNINTSEEKLNESFSSSEFKTASFHDLLPKWKNYIQKVNVDVKTKLKFASLLDKTFEAGSKEISKHINQHGDIKKDHQMVLKKMENDGDRIKFLLQTIDKKDQLLNAFEKDISELKTTIVKDQAIKKKAEIHHQNLIQEYLKKIDISDDQIKQLRLKTTDQLKIINDLRTENKNVTEYSDHLQVLNSNIEKKVQAESLIEINQMEGKIKGLIGLIEKMKYDHELEIHALDGKNVEFLGSIEELKFRLEKFEQNQKANDKNDLDFNKSLGLSDLDMNDLRNSFQSEVDERNHFQPPMLREKDDQTNQLNFAKKSNIDPKNELYKRSLVEKVESIQLLEIRKNLDQLNKKNAIFEETIFTLKSENDIYKKQIQQLVSEKVDFKTEIDKMKRQVDGMTELQNQLINAKNEIKKLDEINKNLSAQFEKTLQKNTELFNQIEISRKIIEAKQSQLQLDSSKIAQVSNPETNIDKSNNFLVKSQTSVLTDNLEINEKANFFNFSSNNIPFSMNESHLLVNQQKLKESGSNKSLNKTSQSNFFIPKPENAIFKSGFPQSNQIERTTDYSSKNLNQSTRNSSNSKQKIQQSTFHGNLQKDYKQKMAFEFESDEEKPENIFEPNNRRSSKDNSLKLPLESNSSKNLDIKNAKNELSSSRNTTSMDLGNNSIDTSNVLIFRMKKMKVVEPENTKKYSYSHFNVNENKIILSKLLEFINRNELSMCFSDYINRVNKRMATSRKIIVITQKFIFIFNQGGAIKSRYPLLINQIVKIEVNKATNHFNLIDMNNTNEVLQSIRKEELLVFLQLKYESFKKKLCIEYVSKIDFINSDNKQKILDPMYKKGSHQYLVQTFNYAHKYTCIGYALVDSTNKLESIFGSKDCVLVLSNLFIVVFSTVEFNLKTVFPLIGSRILIPECKLNDICLLLADGSKRKMTFNNKGDQTLWMNALNKVFSEIKI